LVALPVLLLAFVGVSQPSPLKPPTGLAPVFDGAETASIADDFAARYPNRLPGTSGALGAENWFKPALAPYGFDVQRDTFTATIRGRKTTLVNLVAEKIGLLPREIVVMAHRDDSGTGSGLNDNASATGALIELARSYAPTGTTHLNSPYSIAFV